MPSSRRPIQPATPEGAHSSGWHRAVYRGKSSLLKKPFPTYQAQIFGRIVHLPMKVRAIKRYGSTDLNAAEWRNYHQYFLEIPKDLRRCFAKLHQVRHGRGRASWIATELVRDYTKEPSDDLPSFFRKRGRIRNPIFWQKFRDMISFMNSKGIPFFDMIGPNIVVRRLSAEEWIPVLVDYKSATGWTHWSKPWYFIPSLRRRRLIRQANALITRFGQEREKIQ